MVAKAKLALDPVADLRRRLARRPELRSCIARWWSDHQLSVHPAPVGRRVALALLEQSRIDLKLAGIHVLQHHVESSERDLPAFERLFAAERLDDRVVAVWFGAKVLGTMLRRGNPALVRALAQWRNAESIWQRHAACAALATVAPHADAATAQHIVTLCSAIVWSAAALDQRAVASLMRELSRADPARVEAFFRRHARFMSRACARGCVARFSPAQQKELLAYWKRATSLRPSQ
jgi:hypothetical protein